MRSDREEGDDKLAGKGAQDVMHLEPMYVFLYLVLFFVGVATTIDVVPNDDEWGLRTHLKPLVRFFFFPPIGLTLFTV